MATFYELGNPKARALLAEAMRADPPRLDLAAVAIAHLDVPQPEPALVLERLDQLGRRVAEVLPEGAGPLAQIHALRRVLAEEEGFSGDREDLLAPENSFLHRVLERRQGLPITLSVLYLEVARRAGIAMFGVGFPGHFVIASDEGAQKLVVDPFHGGQVLTEDGCADLLSRVAPQVKFTSSMIAPARAKSVAYRMLNNLKRSYLQRGEGEQALATVDLMLSVAPDHPGELRARAAILSALGAYRAALADIERCLEISPDAPDHQSLRLTAEALRERMEQLN
ncbi:MAG: SirB1 family protein [Myxococcota bacterium]